jgi:hypothetical protein
MRSKAPRYLIILLALLLNLAFADRAQAGRKEAVCEDPETGEAFECCAWCLFFCGCDVELIP